ncbi:hypothetical protein [Corallococcus macrosporus]|uniref:Uncharacterized protein n=2 Tax=Myxococcaceae TaxID=31 RepID=A0A250JV33_9BACT|nr:hypothetical protein [Corallococcus macrosporus]AEI66308.1 hypothetical protein LILAB_22045 [Corallococcus macrosporus]ATB47211.1 hypothetical protein MYMAC_002819 [Corallococcus macrosporus DSM 14697]
MQPPTDGRPSIFRKEALAHYQRVVQDEGDLLRISGRWTRWTFVLLGVFALALTLTALAWPALIAPEGPVRP